MSRKGVSPVIATLLLIVIAVAAAVVTYSWVMGFIGTTTTTPAQTQARIVVDAVKVDTSATPDDVDYVYVHNVGEVPVHVDAVYLYKADGTVVDAKTLSSSVLVPSGEVKKIPSSGTLDLTDNNLSSGQSGSYYVKVTTEEGAAATSETFTLSG